MDRTPRAALPLIIIVVIALLLPAGVLAKGRPVVEATNNLSVPTIMIGSSSFTGVTCGTAAAPSALVPPTGTPLTGYPISPLDYYYLQGVHKWQGQCYSTTDVVPVTAEWGDNLSGDAKLKTNSPIRVELGLFNDATAAPMDGYTVIKLDPAALDRESAYGTLATYNGVDGFYATATSFTKVRVFDTTVTFSIQNLDTLAYVVQPGTDASAEINATGNVVYGYNLRVSAAGHYQIRFITPGVTVTGVDAGTFDANSVTLDITISGGGGGGKGH
jgi:hypothetical protein